MNRISQSSSDSVGTPLFRSSAEDVALAMAQRLGALSHGLRLPPCAILNKDLRSRYSHVPSGIYVSDPYSVKLAFFWDCAARRFKKQIILSVDTPSSFANPSQANHVVLYMEKLIGKKLAELELEGASGDLA